jgi:hypothetical protein
MRQEAVIGIVQCGSRNSSAPLIAERISRMRFMRGIPQRGSTADSRAREHSKAHRSDQSEPKTQCSPLRFLAKVVGLRGGNAGKPSATVFQLPGPFGSKRTDPFNAIGGIADFHSFWSELATSRYQKSGINSINNRENMMRRLSAINLWLAVPRVRVTVVSIFHELSTDVDRYVFWQATFSASTLIALALAAAQADTGECANPDGAAVRIWHGHGCGTSKQCRSVRGSDEAAWQKACASAIQTRLAGLLAVSSTL